MPRVLYVALVLVVAELAFDRLAERSHIPVLVVVVRGVRLRQHAKDASERIGEPGLEPRRDDGELCANRRRAKRVTRRVSPADAGRPRRVDRRIVERVRVVEPLDVADPEVRPELDRVRALHPRQIVDEVVRRDDAAVRGRGGVERVEEAEAHEVRAELSDGRGIEPRQTVPEAVHQPGAQDRIVADGRALVLHGPDRRRRRTQELRRAVDRIVLGVEADEEIL